MIDIVTIGWLTIDDIVLPNATCQQQVIGGGALYSAIGARIWHDRVGIHSVTGEKYIKTVTNEISQRGLDVTGLNSIGGSGLELWILHETETEKQQVPKLTSSTAQEMDSGRRPLPEAYRGSRGFHIAPQTPASSIANVRYLSSFASEPIITLDILADTYIDANQYLDLNFLKSITAFIPSREEVHRIWHPTNLSEWIQRAGGDLQPMHRGENWEERVPLSAKGRTLPSSTCLLLALRFWTPQVREIAIAAVFWRAWSQVGLWWSVP